MKKIITAFLIAFVKAQAVLAAPLVDPNSEPATTATAVEDLIKNLQGIVLGAAGAIAMAMIIYGAIVLGTAGGNEDKIGKGKKILTYAIGGLIFILLSGFLIGTFIRLLGGNVN